VLNSGALAFLSGYMANATTNGISQLKNPIHMARVHAIIVDFLLGRLSAYVR
jgi:hypothetical protein